MEKILLLFLAITLLIYLIDIFFSKKARVLRKLKRANFKSISKFKNGEEAKLIGSVVPVDKHLVAPLSKRKCYHYHILVRQRVSQGKRYKWKTIIEEEVFVTYLIKDGKHFAKLNGNRLNSYLVNSKRYSSGYLEDATDDLEAFLHSKGYKSEGFLGFNKTLSFKESVLEEGGVVSVYGKGTWNDSLGINEPLLEISEIKKGGIYISDAPVILSKR